MDLKETGKRLKPFAPVLSVAVVASCVASSLSGYQPPVYAAQEQSETVKNVLKNQNTDVDTVSGATYSSKGLLGAIKNALKQAEKVTNGESIEEKADTTELENAVKSAEALVMEEYTQSS